MRHSYHIQFYWIPRPGVTSSTLRTSRPAFDWKKTKLDLINCEDNLLQHMIFLVEGPTNRGSFCSKAFCFGPHKNMLFDMTSRHCTVSTATQNPTPCASWRSVPCLVITCSGMKSLGREVGPPVGNFMVFYASSERIFTFSCLNFKGSFCKSCKTLASCANRIPAPWCILKRSWSLARAAT